MGLFSSLRKLFGGAPKSESRAEDFKVVRSPKEPSSPELKEIGIVDAVCPYCSCILEKKPGRKKKCPECGNFIYVRTRPLDREKILITEQQILEVEEQWAIANGRHEEFLASRQQHEDTKTKLREKFGREPADHDVQWAIYNKELMEHARNGDWGLYRNVRFNMAEILRKESRDKDALSTYLEVCYLDLNGPSNTGGLDDPELLQQYPPFDRKLAFLAPAILSRINGLVKKLELDNARTKAIFDKVAALQHKNLPLPMSPDRAWRKLKKELFG